MKPLGPSTATNSSTRRSAPVCRSTRAGPFLAGRDVPMTLLLFNLGIELGQIGFAAARGVVLWGCYRLLDTPARRARLDHAAAYGLGAAASFWVIDRVAGFWG